MKEISLPRGVVTLVDDEDFELAKGFAWYVHVIGYAYCDIWRPKRKGILLHRLIMGLEVGDRRQVDHINGNKLDNRRSNLRICTHAENMKNRKLHKNNKSGFKGVYWDNRSQRWRASIRTDGKVRRLGFFHSAESAFEAYKAAAIVYHGAFASDGF